jgi:hypothetical protein
MDFPSLVSIGLEEIGARVGAARHARKTRRPVRLKIGRGGTRCGRAGQAFELVGPGVIDRVAADSSPKTAAGRNRMTMGVSSIAIASVSRSWFISS